VGNAESGTISQYNIGTGGMLTPMIPATIGADLWIYFVAVDPSGTYLYTANGDSYIISLFRIGADGALTPNSPATIASAAFPSHWRSATARRRPGLSRSTPM